MIKVEGHSNLYRDENSGAIINHDSVAYNQYINSINQKELKQKELDDMRKDIDEIKTLLRELLQK
jgi:adenylate kinase